MEELLVSDALDERDFLRKKIASSIKKAKFIGVKRVQDDKIGALDVADFEKNARSSLQSIKDMIDRYRRIDVAITLSNANTKIKTKSGQEMTVAAAIAMRKQLKSDTDFSFKLLDELKTQWEYSVCKLKGVNSNADLMGEKVLNSFLSKESTKTIETKDNESLKELTKGLYGEMVDPIKIEEEIQKLEEEHSVLLKELETAIKVSNATTTVKF